MDKNIIMIVRSLLNKVGSFKDRIKKSREGTLKAVFDEYDNMIDFEGSKSSESFKMRDSDYEDLKRFICLNYEEKDDEFDLLHHLNNLEKVCIPIWLNFCENLYKNKNDKIDNEDALLFLDSFDGGCDLVLLLLENVIKKAR